MEQLKNNQKGFSTLELMIAMAIIVMVLSAVVMTSFGSQAFLVNSQTNEEAMKIAQKMIEQEEGLTRKDFNLVNATTNNETDTTGYCPTITVNGTELKFIRYSAEDVYCERIDVNEKTPEYTTKEVTARVTWKDERGNWKDDDHMMKLTTLVTNFNSAEGNDTCNSSLSGDWTNPKIEYIPTLSGKKITDIDAYRGKLYVTVNNTSGNTDSTLFVFNIDTSSDPNNPKLTLIDSVDNSTVSAGLNAVVVAGHYVYVANGYGADFNTCAVGGNCAQLQIFDINNLHAAPINLKIPGVFGKGGQSIGDSIFYKNNYIFLGLAKTGVNPDTGASNGPEFNIIDVHNPLHPFLVSGNSYSVGNAVNSIYVKNQYAYLATPNNNQELTVLDLDDMSKSVKYDTPGNSGNGKSIYTVGDNLYLGKTVSSTNNEFMVLNNSYPLYINKNNPSPASMDIGASVNGLIVRDYLAFLLTNNELNIVNIKNPENITNFTSPVNLPNSSSSGSSSIDCEGNYIYAATNSNGGLYIINS
jgi:prepilin-type N-terminal cleavage/methylation domain-containing protein